MKMTANKKKIFLFCLVVLAFGFSFGVYKHVEAIESSNGCAYGAIIPGCSWDSSVLRTGSGEGNPAYRNVSQNTSQNPYLQPFSVELTAGGHTHYWGNPGVESGGAPSGYGSGSDGTLYWTICFEPGHWCYPGSQYYPETPDGVNIDLQEQVQLSDTDYRNFQYVVGHVEYLDNNYPVADFTSASINIQ